MSKNPTLPNLISLADIAECRIWCPLSGTRSQSSSDRFSPDASCIGPRCGVWEWAGAGDAQGIHELRCYLVPPHFDPSNRVRLASEKLPDLLGHIQTLASGEGDIEAAQGEILAWAHEKWRPEDDQIGGGAWGRRGAPFWDVETSTVALDIVLSARPDSRWGFCGLKRPTIARE